MVGQLIRLKARMTWNTLSRQTVVLVLGILGILYGLAVVVMAAAGVLAATIGGHGDLVNAALVIAGALLVGGWWIVPVLFASLDNTLDPRRFAPYIGPSPRFGLALVAATGVGVGGLFTLLASLLPALAWFGAGRPVAGLGALLVVPLALLIAFTWSRAISTWLGIRLSATSNRRDLTTVVATVLFVAVLAPAGLWVQFLTDGFDAMTLHHAADVAAWTPVGAPWGMVRSFAAGAWGAGLAQLLASVATLALGWWLWMRVLPAAMSGTATPVTRQVEEALDAGRVRVDPTREPARHDDGLRRGGPRPPLAGVQRWQRLGLSPQAASLAQRTALYWIRDPRLSTSLLTALLFPAIAVFLPRLPDAAGDDMSGMGVFFLLFMGFLLGTVTGTLQQYDSTALWILVASGIRGRDERLGRLVGTLPVVLVLMAVGTTAGAGFSGFLPVLGPLLTAVFVSYACAAALAMVIGARWVFPVQPPGTSPLATKGTGQFMTTALIQSLELVGGALLAAPALGLLAAALWGPLPWWVAVPVAVAWSVAALWGGVRIGGRLWDGHAVDVLTTIRSWPGHRLSA